MSSIKLKEVLDIAKNTKPKEKTEISQEQSVPKKTTVVKVEKNNSVQKIELIPSGQNQVGKRLNIYLKKEILDFLGEIKKEYNIENDSQAIKRIILTFKEMKKK